MSKLIIIALASVAWLWSKTMVRCLLAGMLLLAIHPVLLLAAFVAAVVYMRRPSPDTAEDRAAVDA